MRYKLDAINSDDDNSSYTYIIYRVQHIPSKYTQRETASTE